MQNILKQKQLNKPKNQLKRMQKDQSNGRQKVYEKQKTNREQPDQKSMRNKTVAEIFRNSKPKRH